MSESRPTTAAGAAGVERAQDEVAGQRRLEGDLGGRAVADLADGDHLGVLPQERPEPDLQVNPAAGLTCDCATPGTATSIGSSSVARLRRPSVVATSSRRQA